MDNKAKLGAESGKRHAHAGQTGTKPGEAAGPPRQLSCELASFAGGDPHSLKQHLQGLTGVLKVAIGQMCVDEAGLSVDRPSQRVAGVVQLSYNPVQLSYPTLLGLFFACHDPTVKHEQASQLQRSIIFFHSPLQEQLARREIARLSAERRYRSAILTEVLAATDFVVQPKGRHVSGASAPFD